MMPRRELFGSTGAKHFEARSFNCFHVEERIDSLNNNVQSGNEATVAENRVQQDWKGWAGLQSEVCGPSHTSDTIGRKSQTTGIGSRIKRVASFKGRIR
mmetsp:Transcript_61119/g.132755  ORF Transcript_61119/g.132755 Transcript_61119/m.132755 type:complete len:99 (-) Transcript_61119:123-419(-)